jgi:hypothetical protein
VGPAISEALSPPATGLRYTRSVFPVARQRNWRRRDCPPVPIACDSLTCVVVESSLSGMRDVKVASDCQCKQLRANLQGAPWLSAHPRKNGRPPGRMPTRLILLEQPGDQCESCRKM